MNTFDESNKQQDKALWMKWGKPGDRVEGTYIDRIEYDQEGEQRLDHLLLVESGYYHDNDGNKVELEKGSEVRVNDKKGFEKFKKGQIKAGQLVGLMFEEEIKLKGAGKKKLNPFKKVAVFLPKEEAEEVSPDTNEKHKAFKPKYNKEWLAANDLTVEDVQAA